MTKTASSGQLLIFLSFAAIYTIWGSTYLAVLIGLESFPPFLLAALRFFVAGALLLGWCSLSGGLSLTGPVVRNNAISGILMLFGGTGSVIWGEQYVPSGLAAIIVTTLPLWFVILDRSQWRYYFTNPLIIVGLMAGFAGVVLLVTGPQKKGAVAIGDGMYWVSILVLIFGVVSWAVGSLYAKYRPASPSTLVNAGLQLVSAGLFSGAVSGLTGEWNGFALGAVSGRAWMALLYMILMGSVVAYLAYLWLLQVRPPAVVGTYTYVNPVIAVLLGLLFAHEAVTGQQIMALGAVLIGVLLVNLPKYYQLRTPAGDQR